jgi:DNA polymerase III delta subunit
VAPFILKEYQEAARRFPLKASVAAMKLLLKYDRKLKGVDSGTTSSSEWLKELLLLLIHLQKAA